MPIGTLTKKKMLLTSKMDLNLSKKLVNCYLCNIALYGTEIGYWELLIRNTWKVFKCGAGERWRRSFGQIVCKMIKYYTQ
jgi:hypothetical protein